MMSALPAQRVDLIPVDRIKVLNPRERNHSYQNHQPGRTVMGMT
jgi:hypothetical protein